MANYKTFRVSLDMKAPTAQRNEWEVVEGDNGNIIEIALTDDGEPVDLTGCKVLAVFGLPTGVTVEQDTDEGSVTIGGTDNNVITIALRTGSFSPGKSSSGLMKCEIQVYSGLDQETLITSAQFTFRCRRAIMNDETIAADDNYPILVELIETVQQMVRTSQSNWNETDPTNIAYIQNKPDLTGKIDTSVLAAEYDSTATYAQYDHCTHGGKLYYCPNAISTAEAWNSSHWTEVKVTSRASTSRYGFTRLSSSTSSSSTNLAATPSAVRTAYNLAAAAIPSSEKGAADGVAELDDNPGIPKVKADQTSARIKSISVASYTLQLGDAGLFLDVTNGANVTLTIPTNASVAFPVGTEIEICRDTSYTVTAAAASGVTIRSVDSQLSIADQYGCAILKKLGTDTWLLGGALG